MTSSSVIWTQPVLIRNIKVASEVCRSAKFPTLEMAAFGMLWLCQSPIQNALC